MSRIGLSVPGSRPDIVRVFNRSSIPDVANGGPTTQEMPRGHAIKRVFLDLRVDLTEAAGAGTVITDNPWTLLQSVRISGTRRGGGGRVTWKSAPAALLYWAAAFKRGLKPYRVQLASGAAQANTILRSVLPIEFYSSNMADNGRGMLFSKFFDDLRVDLTWGRPTDLISANCTINSATCDLITHEIPGLEPDPDEPTYANIEESALFSVTATQTRGELFKVGTSGEVKSMLFRTTNQGTAGRPLVNTIVSGDLEVNLNGQFVSRKLSWEQLRGFDAYVHGPGVHPIVTDAAGTRAIATGTEFQPPDGYAFLDFAPNGGEDGLIQAGALDSFKVFADVTTNGNTPQVEMLLNRFEPLNLV